MGLKKMFSYKKSFFFNIFYSFNPNHVYWNQRRLFSGNLPGIFSIFRIGFFVNGFPNPFIVRSRSSFLFSQWKFELYIRIYDAMCFCFVVWCSFFVLHLFTSQSWIVKFSEWLLPLTNRFCARDVISHSL